jgi:hypothetical protein
MMNRCYWIFMKFILLLLWLIIFVWRQILLLLFSVELLLDVLELWELCVFFKFVFISKERNKIRNHEILKCWEKKRYKNNRKIKRNFLSVIWIAESSHSLTGKYLPFLASRAKNRKRTWYIKWKLETTLF